MTYPPQTVGTGQTIIDSGTTLIYGPPSAVYSLYQAIPGSELFDVSSGMYSFPCDATPNIAFNWGVRSYTMSAASFNLGNVPENDTACVGSILGATLGLGRNVWLLGDR